MNETDDADDDTYIIEDTGESLSEFSLEEEEKKAATAGQPAGGDAGADSPELERLRTENLALRDQFLRSRADFENFRKRTEREKADFRRYALSDVLRDLLPVLDNFERAIEASGASEEVQKGIELIHKQFSDVLSRHGLKPIDEAGVPFDPEMHEAVMRDENSDLPSHTVIDVLQKGYFLNDRLLRPAMVRVAVGNDEEGEALSEG